MDTRNRDTTSTDASNTSQSTNEDSPESSSENKSNSRGTKIARIRSFKDDFFGKISTISRTPKGKHTQFQSKDDTSKPAYDLNYHAKLFKHALTHFNDVVKKNKLEMLHGNVTIVLESVANIESALKAQKFHQHSSAIYTCQQQVHHSLGSLIKLCDDALISDNEENYIALNKENVKEITDNLDNAVSNLINQANKKTESSINAKRYSDNDTEQRSSLPDIPLSKWEKAELEKSMMQNSHSSENILHLTPPPKPSKDRRSNGPPLPPKQRKTFEEFERPNLFVTRSIDFPANDFRDMHEEIRNNEVVLRKMAVTSSTITSTEMRSDESDFASAEVVDCKLQMSHEFNSRVVHEMENSFNFMSVNQSNNLSVDIQGSSEPPPLPRKSRMLRVEHNKSVYDNVDDANRNSLDTKASTTSSNSSITSSLSARTETFTDFNHLSIVKNKYKSCIESGSTFGIEKGSDNETPPPLPMKKKHIMAYMEIFGNASHSTHMSSSPHDVTLMRHTMSFSNSTKSQSFQSSVMPKNIEVPPLPPKKLKINSPNTSLNNIIITPPISPRIMIDKPATPERIEQEDLSFHKMTNDEKPAELNSNDEPKEQETVVLRKKQTDKIKIVNLMEELDVQAYLLFRKDADDGPLILTGAKCVDALIIHSTQNSAGKAGEAFAEAFLATFRTFIDPTQLTEKLISRYTFFNQQNNDLKQRAAKESFSLLVRVVNDLTCPDLLDTRLMAKLVQFVQELICSGNLLMAKLLRVKIIEKATLLRLKNSSPSSYLPSRPIMSNPPILTDLKSTDIAEQMTILDSELFQKIEIPEVLTWAQEQCEERSPNLTIFTEHFNKLSYWARTQILKQQDSRDREKHIMKFIKIMKHLRKINNFNSYLALLSALDSAPIRRLEWQKNITEYIKEYCALIDSSSSFRAYRIALSESNPPCIPYIGLILQDLTFVHIGNPDSLPDGSINFSKRWQQYNIIINMKRFKNYSYSFKKNEKIIGFFDNFDDIFDEDVMWHISEKIKPRGKKAY